MIRVIADLDYAQHVTRVQLSEHFYTNYCNTALGCNISPMYYSACEQWRPRPGGWGSTWCFMLFRTFRILYSSPMSFKTFITSNGIICRLECLFGIQHKETTVQNSKSTQRYKAPCGGTLIKIGLSTGKN